MRKEMLQDRDLLCPNILGVRNPSALADTGGILGQYLDPSELRPVCRHCGAPLVESVREIIRECKPVRQLVASCSRPISFTEILQSIFAGWGQNPHDNITLYEIPEDLWDGPYGLSVGRDQLVQQFQRGKPQ